MFDRAALRQSEEARGSAGVWRANLHATVNGQRRPFEASEVANEGGSVGIAFDLSETEALKNDNDRRSGAYKNLLDRLTTAVAIFDRAKRLDLLQRRLSADLVARSAPSSSNGRPTAKFSTICAPDGSLPEQADFRAWKAQTLSAYQAMDTVESVWHLPDGRALRVVASPNAEGGVTYLFDDATQSFALASQLNALTRLQGETLDALKEGVAVFGADGRLKLVNPAFAAIWRMPSRRARRQAAFRRNRRRLPAAAAGSGAMGRSARRRRSGFPSGASPWLEARSNAPTASVLECAALPLPDGGDADDLPRRDRRAPMSSARSPSAIEALVSAEKLRNDFVKHVSYELRTPLTNIIGFTQLLADGGAGALNRQADRIRRLHQILVGGAARHHQRHSRSRLDRRRRAGAAARGRRRRRSDEGRGRRRAGPAERVPISTCASSPPTASACCAPTGGACDRSCSICFPMRSASPRRARR